jgi:hypothetical protein
MFFFACCVFCFGGIRIAQAGDASVYHLQLKRYKNILNDDVFQRYNRSVFNQQDYSSLQSKHRMLRQSNRRLLRLYDEEKDINERIRELLSKQIEEEFRLRAEFKRIQKDFEEHQEAFTKKEMKELGQKIAEYEKIKDSSIELSDKMSSKYAEYMEFQKEFKKQQEAFYQKQVEFYEEIEKKFNDQMDQYNDIKVDIDKAVR